MPTRNAVGTILAVAVLLSGCATPYQPTGFRGGFDDVALADDMYELRANGNAFTSAARVRDYVLLRASEIARERGFKYFVFVTSENRERIASHTFPGEYSESTTGVVTRNGNTATVSAQTEGTYTPPQVFTTTKSASAAVVKYYREKPRGLEAVFDADVVYKSLSEKYKKN